MISSSSGGSDKMEIDVGAAVGVFLLFLLIKSSIAKSNATAAAAGSAQYTAPASVAINAQNNQTAQDAITAGEVQAGESAAYNLISSFI